MFIEAGLVALALWVFGKPKIDTLLKQRKIKKLWQDHNQYLSEITGTLKNIRCFVTVTGTHPNRENLKGLLQTCMNHRDAEIINTQEQAQVIYIAELKQYPPREAWLGSTLEIRWSISVNNIIIGSNTATLPEGYVVERLSPEALWFSRSPQHMDLALTYLAKVITRTIDTNKIHEQCPFI